MAPASPPLDPSLIANPVFSLTLKVFLIALNYLNLFIYVFGVDNFLSSIILIF
jgi:hypothetical protein